MTCLDKATLCPDGDKECSPVVRRPQLALGKQPDPGLWAWPLGAPLGSQGGRSVTAGAAGGALAGTAQLICSQGGAP